MTRSTPSAIGCWLMGLANVLSITDITPRARQAAATRRDVHAPQRGIDRRLEPEELRVARKECVRLAQARRASTNRARMPNLVEEVGQQVQRAAVDRRTAHDLVARRQQSEQRRRRRGLTAREYQRALGALERRELLLHGDDRRVRVSRIEELLRAPFVVVEHFLRALEQERGRLVDRRRQRRRIAADAFGYVNGLGGWFHLQSQLPASSCQLRSASSSQFPISGSLSRLLD